MGARVSRCGCVLLEKCGEAGRVVLKGPEPASPEDLAAQHHVQPLRPRLVAVLALVGDGVDNNGRVGDAEICDELAGCGQPVLIRASEGRRCKLRRSPRVLLPVGRVRLRDVDQQVIDALAREVRRSLRDLRERLHVWRSGARAKVEDRRFADVQRCVKCGGRAVEAEAASVGRRATNSDC